MIEMTYCGKDHQDAVGDWWRCGEVEGACPSCLRSHIARLEAALVGAEAARAVPEPTSEEWKQIAENARSADLVDFLSGAAAYGLWLRGKIPEAILSDRVLEAGEERIGAEELAVLREVVRLIDEARERYDKRPRGAGGQRMPDEIDDLLCRLYEIALHFRAQVTEGSA